MSVRSPRGPQIVSIDVFVFQSLAQGDNVWTKKLYEHLMDSGQIYLVTATVRSQVVIRFVVCSRLTEECDVVFAWNEIRKQADRVVVRTAAGLDGDGSSSAAAVSGGVARADKNEPDEIVRALTHG